MASLQKYIPVFILLYFFVFLSCGSEVGEDSFYGEGVNLPLKASNISLPYKEGELLVKFRSGVSKQRAQSLHRQAGSIVKKVFRFTNVEHLRLPPGLSVEDALKIYRANPDVEYAEPNYIVRKASIPDDPYFNLQWALNNTGQTVNGITGTPDADIDGPEAWDITRGDGTVTVAVIDTGVDYNHPDLQENIWINTEEICNDGIDNDGKGYIDDCRGWNFAYNNNDPMDDDVDGHGTHVAGIIGAVGNNSIGISGVNWVVKIMPLKFLNSQGSGTIADVIEAIEYAIKMGARVINASYTYPQSCIKVTPSLSEREAIKAAGEAGILFVAAAGNYGCNNDDTPFYPASHPLDNIISVAASDQKDERPYWSNYGLKSVHVAAPGFNIYSTVRTTLGEYDYMSGTSMATPFVTGLSALIISKNSDYTYYDIKSVILSSVDPIPSMDNKLISGGRINAYKALSVDPEKSIIRPSGLSLQALSGSSVTLIWQDNSHNEEGFKIERKTGDEGEYQEIGNVDANTTRYIDSTVEEGNKYYYRVKAYKGISYSKYSNEIPVTTPLRGPSDLVATAISSFEIKLSWTDNSSREEGFKIERKGPDGRYSEIATLGPDVTTYLDKGLSPNTTYYYRLRAYNSVSISYYSNEAVATTLPSPSGGEDRCFIATCVFGSPFHPHVKTLREFRDRYLITNIPGRAFVRLYYTYSPGIAVFIKEHPSLIYPLRVILTAIVFTIRYPWIILIPSGILIALIRRRIVRTSSIF